MVIDPEQFDYDAVFIRRWLLRYGDLCALADNASTAHGLTRSGPTPETLRVGARQHGYSGDRMEWVCVKADIERAWVGLTYNSLESRIVEALMQGHSLRDFGRTYHLSSEMMHEAIDRAAERMAAVLTGAPVGPSFDQVAPRSAVCEAEDCSELVDVTGHGRFCSTRCRLRAWRAAKSTEPEVSTTDA